MEVPKDEVGEMRDLKAIILARVKYHLYDRWPLSTAIELAASEVGKPIHYVRRMVESNVA